LGDLLSQGGNPMKLSTFLTIKAIVCFLFAAEMLLLPAMLITTLGGSASPDAIFFARSAGACLVGIGLICWFARNAARSELRQGILLALFIGDTIGFLVSLLAQLAAVANAMGWVIVAVWLLLAAGLGYFRFLKPAD
jgi:hypothetical protein